MTTPNPLDVMPPLPYSVTYRSSGGAYLYPDVSQRGDWPNSYYRHLLTPGTYTLQVVYFSTGKRLNVRQNGKPNLYVFEAGQTGWLRSPMIQVAVQDGQEMLIELLSNVNFGDDAVETASLNVYPMARYKP